METLRAQMTKEKAQRVRETAMKRFGYSKGSISKAINTALDEWIEKKDSKFNKKPDWGNVAGALKEINMSSVELQHSIFKFALKKYKT